ARNPGRSMEHVPAWATPAACPANPSPPCPHELMPGSQCTAAALTAATVSARRGAAALRSAPAAMAVARPAACCTLARGALLLALLPDGIAHSEAGGAPSPRSSCGVGQPPPVTRGGRVGRARPAA